MESWCGMRLRRRFRGTRVRSLVMRVSCGERGEVRRQRSNEVTMKRVRALPKGEEANRLAPDAAAHLLRISCRRSYPASEVGWCLCVRVEEFGTTLSDEEG